MTKKIWNRGLLGALAIGIASFASAQSVNPVAGQSMLKARPSTFTKNVGQWDQRALFGGHAAGMDFWVSKEGFVFQYQRTTADKGNQQYAGHTVGMLFDGARKFTAEGCDAAGANQYIGTSNSGVAGKYRSVKMNGVYDKVDAVAYFDGKAPRYDFILHPGANSNDVRFAFKGSGVKVVSPTKVSVDTVLGAKFQEGLFAYQVVNGKRVSVPVTFKQIDATHIGFNVGSFDKSKDLVIDPLVYGTYYGGDEGFDEVRGVAADATGNVYITGYTKSPIYPVLYGPFGFNGLGGKDAFVSRLTGDVYVHDYSALIPGTGDDQGDFIRIDSLGNIWVVGSTTSTTIAGDSSPGNHFVMRFRPDPTTILSPFFPNTTTPVFYRFGGPTGNPDILTLNAFSMRPDPNGNFGNNVRMLFTGTCKKTNGATGLVPGPNSGSFYGTLDFNGTSFAVVPSCSAFPLTSGPSNGFPTSTTLTGASFDNVGNFFLSGTLFAVGNSDTSAPNPIFETTSAVFLNGRLQRQNDIWIRKYDANGNLIWSGLVGGAADDHTEGVVRTHNFAVNDIGGNTLGCDPQGNVYIVGRSNSFDYPRTQGVFGEIYVSGKNYITVTKVKADGTQILYSTNINNNSGLIACSGIGVDSGGDVVITGTVYGQAMYNDAVIDPIQPNDQGNSQPTLGMIPLVNPLQVPGSFPWHDFTAALPYIPTVVGWPQTVTSDAWFMIINPTASAIIRSSYVGGVLDEGIFAPFVDPNGDIWLYGWIDTHRDYTLWTHPATPPATPTFYTLDSGFPAGFITQFAFKQFPEPNQGRGINKETDAYFLTDEGSGANIPIGAFTIPFTGNPGTPITMNFRRDGYILRLREILPLISSMSLAPSPIPGGDPQGLANPPFSVGTLNLSGPAPAGGATINLSLDNGTAASFLPTSNATTTTITVPAGSSTVTFNVYSKVVTAPVNVQVKANYSGNLKTATVQIIPWLQSLTINGATIVGGNTTTATVTLASVAPTGGVVVDLSTDLPGLISFPGGNTVTVPAGFASATFTLSTNGVDTASTATINATLLGVTRSGSLGVNVARLTTITLTPNPVAAGSSVTGFVSLDGNTGAAGTLNISINGNPAGYVISPTTVTIPANSNQSASFTITTPFETADIGRVVKAVRVNGSNVVIDGPVTATLNVQADLVSTLSLNPDTIPSGGVSVATVSLTSAAPPGGARVLVSSNKPGIAVPVDDNGVPISEVIVPAGQTEVDFNVQGLFALNGDEVVTISAYRGPSPTNPALVQSADLTVLALTYTMAINPNSVFGGQSATGVITLSSPAIPGFTTMPVTCSDPNVIFTQPTFTVGSATATFSITTPIVTDTETVIFSTFAGTLPPVTATLEIKATETIGIAILPSNRVRQGATIQIQVTVNRNVPVATPGTITFSNPSLLLLPVGQSTLNFTVPAGSNKATVSVMTRRVPRQLTTNVTATCSPSGTGASVSIQLTVMI